MDTKEKILLASLELFSKDGYEAVSVSNDSGCAWDYQGRAV